MIYISFELNEIHWIRLSIDFYIKKEKKHETKLHQHGFVVSLHLPIVIKFNYSSHHYLLHCEKKKLNIEYSQPNRFLLFSFSAQMEKNDSHSLFEHLHFFCSIFDMFSIKITNPLKLTGRKILWNNYKIKQKFKNYCAVRQASESKFSLHLKSSNFRNALKLFTFK